MSKKLGPPNWPKWKQIPEWSVFRAVALSLNIEPEKLETAMDDDEDFPFPKSKEFLNRVEIVRGNLDREGGLKSRKLSFTHRDDTTITAAEFVAWVKRSEWKAPAEMFALLVNDPPPHASARAPSGPWPWGTHETQLLTALAEAAKRFWVNYDPTDPTTAPENSDVINYLKQKHSVAERAALYMAQILRADGLRPGPRKGKKK